MLTPPKSHQHRRHVAQKLRAAVSFGPHQVTNNGSRNESMKPLWGGSESGNKLHSRELLNVNVHDHEEFGAFTSFEENANDFIQNLASPCEERQASIVGQQLINHPLHTGCRKIEEAGDRDVEGLFIRLRCPLKPPCTRSRIEWATLSAPP